MMLEFWEKISYMVQLIAACLIFVLPARKKDDFRIKTTVCAAILLISSYVINSVYIEPDYGVLLFIYWAYYILACIIFAWVGLDGTLLEAVYCAICACAVQHVAFDFSLMYEIVGGTSAFVLVVLYMLCYAAAYRFLAVRLTLNGEFVVNKKSLLPIGTIIVLVWILSLMEVSGLPGFEAGMWQRIIYRIIDVLCCFYVLWVQVNQKENLGLQQELNGINNAWLQQKNQYEVTKKTIDTINRKCHDLKHQIRMLRDMTDEQQKEEYFDEIERAIMIYDTALQTGNKALDTVLMEKGLFCNNHGIQWSCMADGSRLDFMKLEDIYAIFGNALDNAITAVMGLDDPLKRVISARIINQKSLITIQVQNYYDGALNFEGGLPVTTKRNRRDHGYGMKSIRYTAEKYNGTITVQAKDGIFMLQILLPIPEE